jgi:putative hydrolase of the HAD superfamily
VTIRAVLFDATGTLIELRQRVGDSYARIAAQHGVPLPAWRLDDAFRRILAHSEPRLFPDAPRAEVPQLEREWWRDVVRATFRAADQTRAFVDFATFFDELYAWYATGDAWRLRPGVRDCLETLQRHGLAAGVLSNFDHRLHAILDALEITGFFETVTLAGEHGFAKPDARLFEAALRGLGRVAQETLYVGDDPDRDLAGARRAGVTALDVRTLASLAEVPMHLGLR